MNNIIYKFLSLSLALATTDETYMDMYMFTNEKLTNYSVSIIIEIDNLLNEGYTKEEITEMINKTNFADQDPELTKDEANLIKNDALRILDIRHKLYLEEKDNIKKKKTPTNS